MFDKRHVANALRSGVTVVCGIHKEPTEIMTYLDGLERRGLISTEIKDGKKHAVWIKQ